MLRSNPSQSKLLEYLWRGLRLGRQGIRLLFAREPRWETWWQTIEKNPNRLKAYLPKTQLREFPKKPPSLKDFKPDHAFFSQGDAVYPKCLWEAEDPPYVLYYQGNLELLAFQGPRIGIVGTRQASNYALELTHHWVTQMEAYQATILSGMALGVDGVAHRAALNCGLASVAILGTDLSNPYPKHHGDLFKQLIKKGLVLSEVYPDALKGKFRFPERNRLIAALSHALVVIEAPLRSGALITAMEALKLGREVFVAPGPLNPEYNEGGHRLIQDGARLLREPKEIFEILGVARGFSPAERSAAGGSQDMAGPFSLQPSPGGAKAPCYKKEGGEDSIAPQILQILAKGPRHVDKIIHISQKPAPQVLATLTEMSLKAWVTERPGKIYKIN